MYGEVDLVSTLVQLKVDIGADFERGSSERAGIWDAELHLDTLSDTKPPDLSARDLSDFAEHLRTLKAAGV